MSEGAMFRAETMGLGLGEGAVGGMGLAGHGEENGDGEGFGGDWVDEIEEA